MSSSSPPDEQVIWGFDITKGIFKKTVVHTLRITNYRACIDSNCIRLDLLDDIVVMNQHRVSYSNYTSVGGGMRGAPRIGSGRSKSRTIGDLAFIYQGRPYLTFGQIEDPQGVARLAKAARKTLIEKIKTAEKMKKAQLQEQNRQQQQLQKGRISLGIKTTTSDKVSTCPRCSSTNAQGSKYCNNCGFRLADAVAKEEKEGRIMNQRPSSPSTSSSIPYKISNHKTPRI